MHFPSSNTTMNNSSDSNHTFPFNLDSSNAVYCRPTSTTAPSPQEGMGVNGNGNGMDQQQVSGSIQHNINVVQSLLQVQGGSSSQDATTTGGASSPNQHTFWQSCRFCQSKFYVTSDRLLEHEISCPMHLQVQQFLQQQQAQQHAQQQQQSDLQHQLQMQQQQLQHQFNAQQSQFDSSVGGMFGNNMMYSSNAIATQANDLSQGTQGLNSLLALQQQQTQSSNGMGAHAFNQVSSSSNDDQFESAIDRLPAFHTSFAHYPAAQMQDTQPQAPRAEPKALESSSPDSVTDYFPLAMAEDEEWLTPLHCFVRKYCVEVFVATLEDVAAPCMGKRNPVSVSQVGIRCPYCSPERMGGTDRVDVNRARENGVVYPSLISRIYNSSINLLQRHLRSCSFVPPGIISQYEELKSSNARSGASKKYWADSAMRLGLLDTPNGIRLDKGVHKAHVAQASSDKRGSRSSSAAASLEAGRSEAPPLVLPTDKRNTTAFTFHLMSQMQPCVFTEADRLGRRRNLTVGFAGLACRHCFGVYGSGRFFPSSVKTMADASKTLDVIYRHVMKCKNCPCDIKGGLRNLRDFHDNERSKMPFGNQRAFFVKIWGRLHEGSDVPSTQSVPQALPSAVPALPAPAMAAAATTAHAVPSASDVKLNDNRAKPNANGESLHGLYAMVKRESGNDTDRSHNKLVTEAA